MVGGSQRRVNSLYQRARPAAPAADEEPLEGRRRRSRRRDPSPPVLAREECEQVTPEDEDEEDVRHEDEEERHGDEEEEEEATGGGSATSGGSGIYLRGPASLPQRPIPPHRRPLIRPDVEKSWTIVQSVGCHTRQVNGILGLLCKEHFPGFVQYAGVTTPAYMFDHYVAADDARDRDGRQFDNKAERVKAELWDFFRCQEGMEERAALVATKVCKKLVKDMHYEAHIQAVITYHGVFLGTKVTKAEARTMTLTRQQYLEAIPSWCASYPACWAYMVDKWCAPEWEETHNACRERRLMMPGVPHHQGSRNLSGYAQTWSSSHGGQPCSQFKAWAMAHKGKATSDVDYNSEDPPSAYSNATVHSRLNEYTSVARAVHGTDYDPSTQDFDGEVVMRAGGGKKHGRYWLGDGVIDTAATPSLSQIRASSTSASPAIRPRPDTAQHRMEALQAQLEEEKRRREELEMRMVTEREALEARMVAERVALEARMAAEREAEQRRLAEILQYMQSLGAAQGMPPPPGLFAPPPPPDAATPNQSAASNEMPHASNPSPNQSRWP